MTREIYRIERRRPARPSGPVAVADGSGQPSGDASAQPPEPAGSGDRGATNGAGVLRDAVPDSAPAPAKRRPARIFIGTEGQRTVRPGRHAGDRAVRIVRPRLEGVHVSGRGFVTVEREPEPTGAFGRGWRGVKRALIGAPIRSAHESHERLTKLKALAVFASDNISSSAYATEEIMRVLVLAGTGALALTMPLTAGIVVLLAIVAISYQQTIRAYPSGGGSYIVASD